jgi:hypothetical protein
MKPGPSHPPAKGCSGSFIITDIAWKGRENGSGQGGAGPQEKGKGEKASRHLFLIIALMTNSYRQHKTGQGTIVKSRAGWVDAFVDKSPSGVRFTLSSLAQSRLLK